MNTFDVAIAGAGLIGGSIAWELASAGLRVALFDKGEPGQEASWAGAGIISPAPENPAAIPLVSLAKAGVTLYPGFIAQVEADSDLPTGYRPKGTLQALFSRDAARELSTIIALHHGLGLRAEALRADEARDLEPALSNELEAAVLRPDEASVDNRALTRAVLEAARKRGAQVFSHNSVTRILREGPRCTGLSTQHHKISAKFTIIAAGSFSGNIPGVESWAPIRPAKGQMIALRAQGLPIDRVLWSEKIYLVPRNDGRVLAGATVEYVGFDKEVTVGGLEKLLAPAIELVPDLAGAPIDEMWAGLRPDSPDHLPILGPTDLHGLLIATGHFRSGILLAPITARLIREFIVEGRVSMDWDRFSPARFAEAAKHTQA